MKTLKIEADIHTHTIVSGHAYGTLLENVHHAAETGLKLYGFAEHGPATPGACNPFYFRNVKVIPRMIEGVRVIRGCEMNVLDDGTYDLDDSYLKYLDYCYIGIHPVCYQDSGKLKNTEKLIRCMQQQKVFVISHPDDDNTAVDYDMLTDACLEYHVALEVNNSSFLKPERRLHLYDNYRQIFSLCSRKNVPVILGSDAHFPTAVGDVSLALDFALECGFKPEMILNFEYERILDFIGVSL